MVLRHCLIQVLPLFISLLKQPKTGAWRESLGVRWLGFSAFTAQGPDSIPGQGTKIAQATPGEAGKLNKWRRKDTFIKKMQSVKVSDGFNIQG